MASVCLLSAFAGDPLFRRWCDLCDRMRWGMAGQAAYEVITRKYATPPRAYHNLKHVAHCLAELDRLQAGPSFDAIEIALWFHDAIYDSQAKDNEKRSAALAVRMLSDFGAPASLPSEVRDLILATRHDAPPSTPASAIIVDVDLAILGQSPAIYDRYEAAIREEYAWVDDDTFARGRRKILQSFLDREFIYTTQEMRHRYEASARKNLTRALQTLAAR